TFTELVCSSFYCSAKKEKSAEHRPWCFGCQGPGLPGRVAPLGVRFVRRKSWKRRWSEVAREAGLINRRAGAETCFTRIRFVGGGLLLGRGRRRKEGCGFFWVNCFTFFLDRRGQEGGYSTAGW